MQTPVQIADAITADRTWDHTEGLHGAPIDYGRLARLIVAALASYGAACAAEERERCAVIADAYADPSVLRSHLRIAAEIGTDAGAGDAIGSSSTARKIAAAIRRP